MDAEYIIYNNFSCKMSNLMIQEVTNIPAMLFQKGSISALKWQSNILWQLLLPFSDVWFEIKSSPLSPAAGGRAEQNVSVLHLDQRGEDRRPGAGGTATEQRVQEPGGKIHRDGRRCGQHIHRQHEGTVDHGCEVIAVLSWWLRLLLQ